MRKASARSIAPVLLMSSLVYTRPVVTVAPPAGWIGVRVDIVAPAVVVTPPAVIIHHHHKHKKFKYKKHKKWK